MRYINKDDAPPESIRSFVRIQMAQDPPVNLDYENGFSNRKSQLLKELTFEQFGLCAYTGLPVDERLDVYNTLRLLKRGISYRAHNEHIKAQSVCREEAGAKWGVQPCDDIDHRNIVAAVEVRGSSTEQFGAVVRGNSVIALPPTNKACESEIAYLLNGEAKGSTDRSTATIEILKLNHDSLVRYRNSWITEFLSDDSWQTPEDLIEIINRVEQPVDGKLMQFSFCIVFAAKQLLTAINS